MDPAKQHCLLPELKHVKKESEMAAALREAESQLIQKKYACERIYEGDAARIQYGMAFCGKCSRIVSVH